MFVTCIEIYFVLGAKISRIWLMKNRRTEKIYVKYFMFEVYVRVTVHRNKFLYNKTN